MFVAILTTAGWTLAALAGLVLLALAGVGIWFLRWVFYEFEG